MQDQSYTINFIVLITISTVWCLIVIMEFELVLLMVILSIILSYDAICINNNAYHYIQDSTTSIQGKIIFVCVLFDHDQWNGCIIINYYSYVHCLRVNLQHT